MLGQLRDCAFRRVFIQYRRLMTASRRRRDFTPTSECCQTVASRRDYQA